MPLERSTNETPHTGASAHDPVLPTLALQYPGVTRLDCFLTWLRSTAVAAGVIDTPLPRYSKGLGVTDEYPHPYGNEHSNPYSPTLLFNPRYTGELLATLAEAQQFSIILHGLAIFYPNASLSHFVQGLRCLCADRYKGEGGCRGLWVGTCEGVSVR
jgi:hypothetical protein